MDLNLFERLLFEGMAAAFIGPAFSMIFGVREQYLVLIAASSALGRVVRLLLTDAAGFGIVPATFVSAALISFIYIFAAPPLKVPRPVFTAGSIICLLPGIDAYRALFALIGLVHQTETEEILESIVVIFYSGIQAGAVIMAIGLGIAVMPIFFYRFRHRKL